MRPDPQSFSPMQRFTADIGLVSADPIFVEVLAHVSRLGPAARATAAAMIDELRADDAVTIVRQTPELFDAGLNLYRRRLDKGYGLTDCMSMFVCQQSGITDVLTHDRHFEQECFTLLL